MIIEGFASYGINRNEFHSGTLRVPLAVLSYLVEILLAESKNYFFFV